MSAESPALVFIHGFLGSAVDWRDLPVRIAPDPWHVCLDVPGHGDDVDAPESAFAVDGCVKYFSAVLRSSQIGRFVVVGYSMGGRLALHLALAAGDACAGAVVVSAGPGIEAEAERSARREHDEAWANRFESEPVGQALEAWYQQPIFASLRKRTELLKQVLARRRRNDGPAVARALRGLGSGVVPSLWGRLPDLKVPVLFIAGADDEKYVAIAQRAAGLCPRGRAAIVPGAGHAVHEENPDEFCGVVREFLKTIGTGCQVLDAGYPEPRT